MNIIDTGMKDSGLLLTPDTKLFKEVTEKVYDALNNLNASLYKHFEQTWEDCKNFLANDLKAVDLKGWWIFSKLILEPVDINVDYNLDHLMDMVKDNFYDTKNENFRVARKYRADLHDIPEEYQWQIGNKYFKTQVLYDEYDYIKRVENLITSLELAIFNKKEKVKVYISGDLYNIVDYYSKKDIDNGYTY